MAVGSSFWDDNSDDYDRPETDDRQCQQCGDEVTKEKYFNNDDCPNCGKPCSSPF